MHKYAKELMEEVKNCIKSRGTDNFTDDEICKLEKWSTIAKNMVCFDKDYHVVEAMEKDEKENVMGYRGRDEMNGQFVDRSVRRGYKPYLYWEDDEWIDGYLNNPKMGYSRNATDGQNMRMEGYSKITQPNQMGYMMDNHSKHGRSYDGWREAKRYYTETHDVDSKKKMEEYTKEHINNMIDSVRDMWNEAEPQTRETMKKDLTNLVNQLN